MTLAPGTRLGPYEILGPLGAGGMGEVYRARDTRLDRMVAIKTLRADAIDADSRGRFEREARAIASLTHPHICTLHDVGRDADVEFLVMELLEGETLAARLRKGPLPIGDVLGCATQIADALAAAHRLGIVHRDLKPSNVMLTKSGAVLLDFGLAKRRAAGALAGDDQTEAPLTLAGQLVGTPAYMAPEQFDGTPADQRTDVFAFGAIVYEMTTGRRASADSPPLRQTVPAAPAALERLVAVCLSTDPGERWSSAHDLLLQLRSIAADARESAAAAPPARRWRERAAWSVAAVAGVTALLLGAGALRNAGEPPTTSLDVLSLMPAEETTLERGEAPQVSPDGKSVAFVATDRAGRSGLFVRNRDSIVARPLADTVGASMPFWAPDSRRLGFFSQGQLKAIAIAGGAAHALAPAAVPRGGTWGRDDVILFLGVPNAPLARIPASGGVATPVPMAAREGRQYPSFLPDGRHYLYLQVAFGQPDARRIRVGSVESADSVELVTSPASAVYAGGHLLFRRDAALVAQPFDARTLTLSGSATTVAEDVGFHAQTYQGLFSASDTGVLAYQRSTAGSQPVWFDRQGKRLGAAAPLGDYNTLCLSGDERRIVYDQADPVSGSIDLWALDVGGNRPTRLTFNPAVDFYPICSPSGQDVAFATLRDGPPNLYRLLTSAPGSDRLMFRSLDPKIPSDWSRDGRLLLFTRLRAKTNADIVMIPVAGGEPQDVIATTADERNGRLSPDGRWIAYTSNEGGTFDVFVQPFPPTGAKWMVSKGGGEQPQWRRDGRELFYVTPDKKLMGVEVRAAGDLVVGEARALVDTRMATWERSNQGAQYTVTADGQRFLVNTASDATLPVTLMLNWTAVLRRPAP